MISSFFTYSSAPYIHIYISSRSTLRARAQRRDDSPAGGCIEAVRYIPYHTYVMRMVYLLWRARAVKVVGWNNAVLFCLDVYMRGAILSARCVHIHIHIYCRVGSRGGGERASARYPLRRRRCLLSTRATKQNAVRVTLFSLYSPLARGIYYTTRRQCKQTHHSTTIFGCI